MKAKTKSVQIIAFVVILLLMAACGTQQETVQERNQALEGVSDGQSNYQEAKQVAEVEEWKDIPGKIVNVYLINPVTGALAIPPIQCQGVPNSSTESLEPNLGYPAGLSSGWRVPIEGVDVITQEMAGKDGTFGEPVAFRYCISVDGNYYDFPAMGLPYIVTSASYTFPAATVNRDYATEAKLLIAEEIIKRGGCIDINTLQEIPCP